MKHYPVRHYYAVWYRYQDAISDGDVLARFDSAEERNEFCERINDRAGYGGVWEPVALGAVVHRFDPRKFDTDDAHELESIRTSRGQCVFYVHQRPSYQL